MPELLNEVETILSKDDFHKQLRLIGEKRYHNHHPFHVRMHAGDLSKVELRNWIINRYYYQCNLPVKDSIVMSKLPSRKDRLIWIQRIVDHDGSGNGENSHIPGGIDCWIKLAEAAGISEAELTDSKSIHPGAKFAVDAYINFCRNQSWYEAVASSLTELFAPSLISKRIEIFEEHYSWIDPTGMDYFKRRLSQAPRDCDHALALVLEHGTSAQIQNKAMKALHFKCDVLWSLLDAIELASNNSNT